VEDRSEDFPSDIKLVVSYKVTVVSLEGIEDQSLVGLRDLGLGESVLVSQVEFGGDSTCLESWQFRVHLHVNGLIRLNSKDELVSTDIVKDASGDVLELDSDLDLGLVQC
jgi:hypothetical protein